VKVRFPVKKIWGKVTPLRVTVAGLNPIFRRAAGTTPPTFSIDPGAHGEVLQVANAKFPGSPAAPPLIEMFGPEALMLKKSKEVNIPPEVSVNVSALAEL